MSKVKIPNYIIKDKNIYRLLFYLISIDYNIILRVLEQKLHFVLLEHFKESAIYFLVIIIQ